MDRVLFGIFDVRFRGHIKVMDTRKLHQDRSIAEAGGDLEMKRLAARSTCICAGEDFHVVVGEIPV